MFKVSMGPANTSTRVRLALLLLGTLALGIVTRRVPLGFSLWDKSAGDVLYAVAVTFGIAFVLPGARSRTVALLALIFCFGIELFQLTGIPVALARTKPWVHWILGSTFAWHDLACYAIGVLVANTLYRASAHSRLKTV
jgi:hypothetical protein